MQQQGCTKQLIKDEVADLVGRPTTAGRCARRLRNTYVPSVGPSKSAAAPGALERHLDQLAFILGVRGNGIGGVFLQQIVGLHGGATGPVPKAIKR